MCVYASVRVSYACCHVRGRVPASSGGVPGRRWRKHKPSHSGSGRKLGDSTGKLDPETAPVGGRGGGALSVDCLNLTAPAFPTSASALYRGACC